MPAKQRKEKEEEKQIIIDSFLYSWDQTPGETDVSYRMFLAFKDMGKTRSYNKIVDLFPQMTYYAINQLGSRLQWFKRAKAFDEHQENEFMVKLEEEVIHAKIRQQRIGEEMQKLGEKGVALLNDEVEALSPADIAKLIDIGVKIERLALGTPTEIKESKVDAKVEIEVEKIDPEIAKEIGKLIATKESEGMVINV